jgi:hypothetical protein
MIELLRQIKDKIKTRADTIFLDPSFPARYEYDMPVYLEEAPQGDAIDYATYRITTSNATDPSQDFFLEIDLWFKGTDTIDLERLADGIDEDFHKWVYHSATLNAHFQRINRLMIPDPDATIRRRQLRYLVRTYE